MRYEGEEPTYLPPGRPSLPPGRPSLPSGHPSGAYPVQGGYVSDGYASDSYPSGGYEADSYAGYGEVERFTGYQDADRASTSREDSSPYRSPYDPGSYNGSELSRPGIDGLGYDLSEIIGTHDFPTYGYDEPSVERLSYDDPRYEDGYGNTAGGSRYDGSSFGGTQMDNFWADGDGPHGGGHGGSGDGGRFAPAGPGAFLAALTAVGRDPP